MHSTARDVSWSLLQVGAAARALCGPAGGCDTAIQCASLKSNVGHLEAAAAAAGLASLVVAPLSAGVVAVNAQLRGFCPRVSSAARFSVFSTAPAPQAERPPVVAGVVGIVSDARGSAASSDERRRRVASELVWLQRDHRARGVWCHREAGRALGQHEGLAVAISSSASSCSRRHTASVEPTRRNARGRTTWLLPRYRDASLHRDARSLGRGTLFKSRRQRHHHPPGRWVHGNGILCGARCFIDCSLGRRVPNSVQAPIA